MILYVETNFVLELALEQEESLVCATLRDLFAGEPSSELVLPAFSLLEPFSTLYRRHKERRALEKKLRRELAQLARTAAYQTHAAAVAEISGLLTGSTNAEEARYRQTAQELLRQARVVALSGDVLSNAYDYDKRFGMSLPDAVVLASVVADLRSRSSPQLACFITRNVSDFSDPDIGTELEKLNCKLLFKFGAALKYARSVLVS